MGAEATPFACTYCEDHSRFVTRLEFFPSRFSTVDVAAEVACLRQRCLGMRVANVYDLSTKVQ